MDFEKVKEYREKALSVIKVCLYGGLGFSVGYISSNILFWFLVFTRLIEITLFHLVSLILLIPLFFLSIEFLVNYFRKSGFKNALSVFPDVRTIASNVGLILGVLAVMTSLIGFRVTLENTDFNTIEETNSFLYLYPEEKTNFSAGVEGMTVTSIPRYDGGWNVSVEPSGLINGDFDHIYFMGSIAFEEPSKGWVVKYSDLESFLYNLSVEKGLVGSEAEDLTGYWMSYFPESKYYFISFIPSEKVESSYSVNIEPEPNTFIRRMFYFKPLDSWVDVKEPVVNSVERNGTVAVELSGVLDN